MCYLVVNVQLVVLPGLQRLINSCITLHCGVRQDGTSAVKNNNLMTIIMQHMIKRSEENSVSPQQKLTFIFYRWSTIFLNVLLVYKTRIIFLIINRDLHSWWIQQSNLSCQKLVPSVLMILIYWSQS